LIAAVAVESLNELLWWGLPPVPHARVYIERVMGAPPACHPNPRGRNRPIPCSLAAGLWAAPAIGSQSTARRKCRSKSRAHRSCACGRHAWLVGLWAQQSPIMMRVGAGPKKSRSDPAARAPCRTRNAPLGRASRRWPGQRAFDAAN